MSPLQAVKFWLVQHLALAKDALHIYVGLTLFLSTALAFRWPLRSWKPWAVAAAAALLGEAWDLRDSLVYHTRIDPWGNWHDIWNTLFWPSALLILARTTSLFGKARETGAQ
ncbi:hypothetical protein HZY97_05800 [Sphingomonas sp. R-74633]|uniref:hypothetical protein n=1 Tax=Sphingomonas sp. R-74633 TaxID=2751188 RepID=UPI0015D1858C|nr:hypothetical protein [Sphingomonas sp. R-74633]NYT40261.1 hypothetical protein [Sphingomonas sp. R-74633]